MIIISSCCLVIGSNINFHRYQSLYRYIFFIRYNDSRKSSWKLEDEVTQKHIQFLKETANLMMSWASCGYSAERMFTTDTRLRQCTWTITLVKLSGYTIQEVKERMQPVREAQKSNDHQLAYELAKEIEIDFQIFVSGKIVPREAGGIGYFSGYLTRKVRNLVTCGSCNQFLVSSHTTNYCHTKMPLVRVEEAENLPESFRRMIDLQDCGGLLYPSN